MISTIKGGSDQLVKKALQSNYNEMKTLIILCSFFLGGNHDQEEGLRHFLKPWEKALTIMMFVDLW